MTARHLLCFTGILAAANLINCRQGLVFSDQPAAREGILDLGSWNLEANGPIRLHGPWIFYPGRLATDGSGLTATGREMIRMPPAGAARARPPFAPQLQAIPHFWNRPFPLAAADAPHLGTYVLYLDHLQAHEQLAVRQARTHSALRLWVLLKDGSIKSIGKAGRVGDTPERSRPALRGTVGSFDGPDARALIFEVCDYWTNRGGPWEAPELGTAEAMARQEAGSRSREYWIMGFLFLMGMYHFILYSIRRALRSALFLGLCCLSAIVYAYVWGDFYQTDNPAADVFGITWSLRYSMYFAMAMTAISYAMAILESYPWRTLRLVIFSCALFLMVAIFFAPPLLLTRYQVVLDLAILPCAGYGLAVAYRSLFTVREDRIITAVIAGSGTLISVAAASDILKTYALHDGPRSFHYAASVWMLAQAAIIAIRFERARAVAERVSIELKKIDLIKDEFLANTSHELRTPLNGITGIVESLLGGIAGPLDERMRANLALVAASGRRLSGLVNDIQDISKLNHGEIVLRPRALDLSAILRVVTEISRPLLRGDAVTLVHASLPVPPVYADEDRLQQVLFNLIGNAVKFTSRGNITISARLSGADQTRLGFVEVHVKDTGIGIPADKQEAIFETFVQADGSIAREYGGTGLGLSITKHLIELHGGVLRLESTAGVGSDFFFTLPIAQGPVDDTFAEHSISRRFLETPEVHGAPDTADLRAVTPATVVGTLRALIVDDDAINLQVLHNHLSLEGFLVTEARGGREAMECFEGGQTFDIVLLDVMMPQVSGFEVCRQLRASHSRSELPIIMLTAKNRVSDLVTGLECGANDYLAKPFDPQELRARVWMLVELKRGAKSQSDLAALHGELQVAWKIQQSLLPRVVPLVPGLRVAARYRAMAGVGGDFYTFSASPNHLGVLVTDVSGHGVPAALIVSMVHLAFSFQEEHFPLPDALLASMNRILYNNVGNEFITACYAYIDRAAGTLVTGNAGHPPILLWKKRTRTMVPLRPRGRVLALMPDPTFETTQTTIESGDRVLLYTDGALEAHRSAGEFFGEEGLHRALAENDHLQAEEFAEYLIEVLLEWSGGPDKIADDIAFVIVEVTDL